MAIEMKRTIAGILPRWSRPAAKRTWGLLNAPRARLRLAIGLRPLSYLWGWDRGCPIHRYYLEHFLEEYAGDIRGHCLEFLGDGYITRFGGPAVDKADVLHLDESNPEATIVADLTRDNNIPDNRFDCIVCTHVLHVILDLERAIRDLHRILAPGGVLLVAVPQLSMCDSEAHELWRFTAEGLRLMLEKAFARDAITVRSYGNSLTAAAEIRGAVADEFSRSVLDYSDPRFAVEVCARAIKRKVN